ncbi:MAG: hypothetical protein ACQEUT_17830 [Bacillota bacterium]
MHWIVTYKNEIPHRQHRIFKNQNRCSQKALQLASNLQKLRSMQPERAAASIESSKTKIGAARKPCSQHRIFKNQNRCSQNAAQPAPNFQNLKSMQPERRTASIESSKTKIEAARTPHSQHRIQQSINLSAARSNKNPFRNMEGV